ncbi:acyl-homoserine-lactone synthase [Halomonas llamarensis]|uniref:Acyl-homoserine-lactone synthase n=1 Tax=Halomonas llamarensis TaxID=2945104 RepID=A0ABT0SV59_9GAMM|nr:acyl-homoserine-lactone synthase [Halomonas llamarensis]MCL7931720.1 hypothetical protein [Halomonas llamarensis]
MPIYCPLGQVGITLLFSMLKEILCLVGAVKKLNIDLFGISKIYIHLAHFEELDKSTILDIYRARKKAFIDRREWNVGSYEGGEFESDSYDNHEAYYLFSWDDGVTGCVRLRPSTSPTLLTGPLKFIKKSPDAVRIPDSSMWEASRFFITPRPDNFGNIKLGGRLDPRTLALFLRMIEFGMDREIEAFEVVLDCSMLRIMKRSGWHPHIHNTSVSEPLTTSGQASLSRVMCPSSARAAAW